MKALCLRAGVLGLCELDPPRPKPGEALIRVAMAGICNTDLEIARGYMGFSGVLGHEFCGVVEACEDPSWRGRRVAGEINLACRSCETCLRGLERHCPSRSVLGILGKDGCFAEYLTLPCTNLHALPDGLPDELACFVEPIAAAVEVLEQVEVAPGMRVAVLGDGKLGQLIAQVLASHGCELTLLGKHAQKLERARARGIRTLCEPAAVAVKSFELVVEATGSSRGLARAIELTQPRGTLVLKSTYHGGIALDLTPVVIDEITIVGSRCGPFERALAALAAQRVDPRGLIDAVVPFADAEAGFARAKAPDCLKVLLDMRSPAATPEGAGRFVSHSNSD